MKKIVKVFLGLEIVMILLPIIVSALIMSKNDVYNLRVFLTDNNYMFFLVFLVILVLSIIIKSISKQQKKLIILLALFGIIIHYLLFDFILPY